MNEEANANIRRINQITDDYETMQMRVLEIEAALAGVGEAEARQAKPMCSVSGIGGIKLNWDIVKTALIAERSHIQASMMFLEGLINRMAAPLPKEDENEKIT